MGKFKTRRRFSHKFIGKIEHKHCYQCDKYKDLNEFSKHKGLKDGLSSYCRECRKENRIKKRTSKINPHVSHKILNGIEHKYCGKCDKFHILSAFGVNNAKWDKKRMYCSDSLKTYYKSARYKAINKRMRMTAKYKNKINAYRKKQYDNNPNWRVAALIRGRLNMALKVRNIEKSSATWDLCGCDFTTLKEHIENQFYEGMSWEKKNFHIDHMEPIALFNLEDEEEQRKCFHYTNLKPEWPSQNLSDGAMRKWNMEWNGERWIVHGRL